jgi:hypothetical protein
MMGRSYEPGQILFSNDGPLGRLMSQCHQLPERFTGCWQDLNSIGYREGSSPPGITAALQYLLKPVGFAKFYAPIALFILGLSAWFGLRQFGLGSMACVLGGLLACLNSDFFSAACWGVASHPITVAMSFFALAALADVSSPRHWLRVPLAGLAVGLGVTEGADIGAIFSSFIAAFIVYQGWVEKRPNVAVSQQDDDQHPKANGSGWPSSSFVKRAVVSIGRVTLVALCAGLVAFEAASDFLNTSLKGVVKEGHHEARTESERWDWATQWSLPKREVLSLVVPGLFGYRADTPNGGIYWGSIGRDAAWDRYVAAGEKGPRPGGFTRYSGGGFYAGALVVMIALWAVIMSFVPKQTSAAGLQPSTAPPPSPSFSLRQRKLIWFWLAVSIISLLLAFGRYAPFYRLIYVLPYFSSIRNPTKFLHVFSFALVIFFAYGVDNLARRYMPSVQHGKQAWAGIRGWWSKAASFEKRWLFGCSVVLLGSMVAWAVYSFHAADLVEYLQTVQVPPSHSTNIALFSIHQVGWFVFFFTLSGCVIALIFSGAFSGKTARLGGILLGIVLAMDLGRANLPWIFYWDYQDQYASNEIVDVLRQQPHEHRVAILPFHFPQQFATFDGLYRLQWSQHLFPFYNVQSLDIVQMSRKPADLAAFEDAFDTKGKADVLPTLMREWQLTNTRYLLGPAEFELFLERKHPAQNQLRIVERFEIVPKPGIESPTRFDELTIVPLTNGPYALFEFTNALPRARLYFDWQISTNPAATLQKMTSPSFDPEQTVFVSDSNGGANGIPAGQHDVSLSNLSGHVEFASYAPKRVALKTEATASSMLLLNDRFDPHWTVRVDGKEQRLLHCNVVMRGVFLAPGAHTVEFRFQPPMTSLWVSLIAIGGTLIFLGLVVFSGRTNAGPPATIAESLPSSKHLHQRRPEPEGLCRPRRRQGRPDPPTALVPGNPERRSR